MQAYGSDELDASLLLMSAVKFLSPTDERVLATLAAIEASLVTDALVFRYDPAPAAATGTDGLQGSEGTFSICTFWYVEALTRPADSTTPGSPWRRCSPTPTTSGCSPSRSG